MDKYASLAQAIATVIVAIIGISAARASQRAAGQAAVVNTQTTSRAKMEEEAFERARKFDTETIQRQDSEIAELRAEVQSLREELRRVREEQRSNHP